MQSLLFRKQSSRNNSFKGKGKKKRNRNKKIGKRKQWKSRKELIRPRKPKTLLIKAN
jgi:hypothetical protein